MSYKLIVLVASADLIEKKTKKRLPIFRVEVVIHRYIDDGVQQSKCFNDKFCETKGIFFLSSG